MLTISAQKIAGFTPRWAPFPGFSLLFDTPGDCYRREGDLQVLTCDVSRDPALEFYRRVYEGFAKFDLDRLLQTYLFCPLPPASYHVTAFDVANIADVPECRLEWRDPLRSLLGEVPSGSWQSENPILAPAVESSLARENWNIRLCYDKLNMFGRGGIALHLKAADEESSLTLERFREARAVFSASYRERFGMGAGPRVTPHVSIGYFANAEGGELALPRLADWDARLRECVGEEVLTFRTASLYAFTSMETFMRLPR